MLKHKILLTNDDGVYSAGLRASYEVLSEIGEVHVVVPVLQKSGVGRSISIMEPIRIFELNIEGMKVYAIDGTPTDAVILGIHVIIKKVPDLVVSGINLGENISTEAVTTSGTIGAALEAATQGSPAIAISLELPEYEKFEYSYKPINFSLAKRVLRFFSENVLKKGMPTGVDVLNINIPLNSNGEIEITKLARRLYKTRVEERKDPRMRKYYWIDGIEVEEADEGSDLYALRKGKVSVTPITLDSTAKINFNELKNWLGNLEVKL